MTPRRFAGALALTLAAVVATAVPASAQQLLVTDPVGDAAGGLDLTRAVVQNRDKAVVARVHLAAIMRGAVIVSIDRRQGEGRRLVSLRTRDGSTRSFVARGAFTDERAGGKVACRGFQATWNEDATTVTMRLPSRCLNHGDYGAVRFAVLTELPGGVDADFAPQDKNGDLSSSAWIPRG